MSEIEGKLKEIQQGLEQSIDKKLDIAVSKGLGDDYKKELTGEIKELVGKHKETIDSLEKRLDASEASLAKSMEAGKKKNFSTILQKELTENKGFLEFKAGNNSKSTFEIKAALTTGSNASGDVVPADQIAGYKYDPTRAVRVRQFLPTISMAGNRLQYIQETSYTNNAATRAEASAYGESEFKLDAVDAAARSIGSTIDLTKEMLEDVPMLTGYISTRLPNKVWNVEDTQLLFGNGSAPNLQGIMTSGGGTAFDESSTSAFYEFFGANASAYTNNFDVLVAAKNQATLAEYSPTVALVNPTDYHKMLLSKDANANYVVFVNGVLTVFGIPIFANTAVTTDKFVIGDFAQGCTLGQRDSMEISFSDQNEDNFKKDRITVKGSERIALAIHNPNAFVWGDFSDAKTAMNA